MSGSDKVVVSRAEVELEMLTAAGLVLACVASACAGGSRYGFYRSMAGQGRRAGEARRVFGGAATPLSTFPAACALLDRYWSERCSAAVLAPYWALTAAHCVSAQIAYVKYNSRHPTSSDGDVSAVRYLYRHPGYEVLQEDEGRGMDVTLLHHDVGLLRTHTAMELATSVPLKPLDALRLYNLENLKGHEVQVLGFGRTETASLGEELFEVRLRLVYCERSSWEHCVCGENTARAGSARGVCSGDSGGPVLYRGAQVGVTSMGPLECGAGLADPAEGATSVFTSLYQYADLVNATMHDTEAAVRMRRLNAGAPRPRSAPLALAASAGAALLARPAR